MTYESMIDELQESTQLSMLEYAAKSLNLKCVNEGAIIDTIKKVFGAILDFIKKIRDTIVGWFKKDDLSDKITKGTAKAEEIEKYVTKPIKLSQPYTYYRFDHNIFGSTMKEMLTLEIGGFKHALEQSLLPYYKDYIKTGAHADKIASKQTGHTYTSDKAVWDTEQYTREESYISKEEINEISINTAINLKNELKDIAKVGEQLKTVFDELNKMSARYDQTVKSINSEFMKESSNPEIKGRLDEIVTCLNRMNKHIASCIKVTKTIHGYCKKSVDSINVVLDKIGNDKELN